MVGHCPMCGARAARILWLWSGLSLFFGTVLGMRHLLAEHERPHLRRHLRVWCAECGYHGPAGWSGPHGPPRGQFY